MPSVIILQVNLDRIFILYSQNKPDGTAIMREHRTSAFVVGAGNANT
jgi:hypothetical protein